jgi:hypothetical protein
MARVGRFRCILGRRGSDYHVKRIGTCLPILAHHDFMLTLVEREALVRAFSPGSTLEPGLKGFHQRGH